MSGDVFGFPNNVVFNDNYLIPSHDTGTKRRLTVSDAHLCRQNGQFHKRFMVWRRIHVKPPLKEPPIS